MAGQVNTGTPPAPADWEWVLEDVTCSSCSGVSQVHKQPPAWLEGVDGVKWECRHCGAANLIAGTGKPVQLVEVVECAECNRTFDNVQHGDPDERPLEAVEIAADGSWTCPGCSTPNRSLGASESATSAETGEVTR